MTGKPQVGHGSCDYSTARRQWRSHARPPRHAQQPIFGVLKAALVQTIQYVLKEYFNNSRMDPITFLQRVVTLLARLRVLPDLEILTFAHNSRDPDVMDLLKQRCDQSMHAICECAVVASRECMWTRCHRRVALVPS